jgi:hypothetical protein
MKKKTQKREENKWVRERERNEIEVAGAAELKRR